MTAPTVSIVIPTFGDPRYLAAAIDSVRTQDMTDWEAIVIDDGSAPAHQAAVRGLVAARGDPRIRLLLSPHNRGPARTRNIGIRLARGRYIAFLDGDDTWQPDKLSRQLAFARQTGAALTCTTYRNVWEETGRTQDRTPPPQITFAGLLRHNTIGCSTVMLDRHILGRTYFPPLPMRQDFAHWLVIVRAGHAAAGLDVPLTIRRVHRAGLSANKLRAARHTWQVYRGTLGFGRLRALRHFLAYALAGLRAA